MMVKPPASPPASDGGRGKLFRLRQFALTQERSAMKVGTDAIALGSWTASLDLPDVRRILDVGAGTAILALMMAQCYPSAEVEAIELDAGALLDAQDNIAHSPWAERVRLIGGDFLCYQPGETYGLIISNPPYFASSSLGSPEQGRALARREQAEGGLGLASLIARSRSLLSPRGYLMMVCPSDRLEEVRLVATERLMTITHLCAVASRPGGEVVRYLVGLQPLSLSDGYTPCQRTSLVLRGEDEGMSAQYRALTEAYLLV